MSKIKLEELELLDAYFRASNYLAVGQLYLLDNDNNHTVNNTNIITNITLINKSVQLKLLFSSIHNSPLRNCVL